MEQNVFSWPALRLPRLSARVRLAFFEKSSFHSVIPPV